ncbi:unnamed protein product [Durusdinium trenchii]|uniref:Uncharacterized protein n=1 Tax=Durusdinium trenchii TaxID=1381693 RepID=A0ABP0SEV9_9DINO
MNASDQVPKTSLAGWHMHPFTSFRFIWDTVHRSPPRSSGFMFEGLDEGKEGASLPPWRPWRRFRKKPRGGFAASVPDSIPPVSRDRGHGTSRLCPKAQKTSD